MHSFFKRLKRKLTLNRYGEYNIHQIQSSRSRSQVEAIKKDEN